MRSRRPSWMSTRRATASAVPLAVTPPRLEPGPPRSAALVAPGGAGDGEVGVGEERGGVAGVAQDRLGEAPALDERGVLAGVADDLDPHRAAGGQDRARPEVVALRRALEHVAVEIDRAGRQVGERDRLPPARRVGADAD